MLTSAAHRELEQAHAKVGLMRCAGRAARAWLARRAQSNSTFIILAGPGNNGGDGLALACELAGRGEQVQAVLLGNHDRLPADARAQLERWRNLGREICNRLPACVDSPGSTWIIDALLGLGLRRPLSGVHAEAVHWIDRQRKAGARCLALDVPSGIDADTGARVGDLAVTADATLSFIAAKPGLLTGPALDHVGEVWIHDLGLGAVPPDPVLAAFDAQAAHALLPVRARTSHKGTYGELQVLGGADGMVGAALLAARAAARAGAGKVRVGFLAPNAPSVDLLMPELMMTKAAALPDHRARAVCVGCGLGVSGTAVERLASALATERPIIIDADALNLIAESADLATQLQRRRAPSVLTPHPLEAARLLGSDAASINGDRLRAARDLARGYGVICVLKGAGSIVAAPDGRASINLTGNPLLATAGTGDVLAGIIGALLAQGLDAWDAARIGTAWHGACADRLAAAGNTCMTASDLLSVLSDGPMCAEARGPWKSVRESVQSKGD
ncbi:MAG: NAD(P)H-hydrate dehydratase [Casimicrobiaceae bacterium]